MRIVHIHVENFRGLQDVAVPLSPCVCVVGHNNAGKSSFLVALSLLISGSRIAPSDFYDEAKDVVIKATFEGVGPAELDGLAGDHRERIQGLVSEGRLTLVRRYPQGGGAGSLRCLRPTPSDARWGEEAVEELLKGKRGAELRDAVAQRFPELSGSLDGAQAQKDFRAQIDSERAKLPASAFTWEEGPLPTGLENSVAALLPQPILIPAVKDVVDDLKTKEAATFGKILKFLLDEISGDEQLAQVSQAFEKLHGLLNVIEREGSPDDQRIEGIRTIEGAVARHLQSQFPGVGLQIEIPPPDLKTVIGNARIFLHDGVRAQVETKGDGLKRATTIALLRASADLRKRQMEGAGKKSGRYLFLFEEPELYLHPQAQRVLFDSLVEIAREHQVCVTTHSPFFFSPTGTGTFIRFGKPRHETGERPPATRAKFVDLLSDMPRKDAFQIICYENNCAAFFCERVVLVEGDSDLLYLKAAARRLDPAWDFDAQNVAVVRVSGKGNFRRYREFFAAFGLRVHVIADLDALVDQFQCLCADDAAAKLQGSLIQAIDAALAGLNSPPLRAEEKKKIGNTRSFVTRYEAVREVVSRARAGAPLNEADIQVLDELYAGEQVRERCWALRTCGDLRPAKEGLAAALRGQGIHVLCRGTLEDYYPHGTAGGDKPSKALDACTRLTSREEVLRCCDAVNNGGGGTAPELELLFGAIFSN